VHLLGSIHVARPDVYPLAPAIDTAFERSSTLVLEIQLDDGARREASAQLIAAASYPAGDSLDKHIPAPLLERLRARATPPLPPVEALFRFEPWFVSQLLMMTELTKLGFAEDNGIDRHFQRRAQGTKRIEALETIEDQVALLDRLPPDIQVLMLSESLDELGELGPMLERAFEAWKRGDGQALYNLLMKSLDEPRYAPLKKRLFSDRNLRMAAAIQERLRKHGSWFVIVGSGHLIGPDGILALLEAQGIHAEQL
jgi:uncharacterized protein YbaP (TraB family)